MDGDSDSDATESIQLSGNIENPCLLKDVIWCFIAMYYVKVKVKVDYQLPIKHCKLNLSILLCIQDVKTWWMSYILSPDSNKPPEVKNWDKARETPPSIDTGEAVKAEYWVFLERVAKAVAYVVTFFVVLGCAIVSKSSTLFMLKQIAKSPNNIPFCNAGRRGNPYIPDNDTEAWVNILPRKIREKC